MNLIECPDQIIELQGFSRHANFQLSNSSCGLYTKFQIKAEPASHFIIIPESGVLAPNETKHFKLYLSKQAVHKRYLPDSYIEVEASQHCAINSPQAQANKRWTLIVPVEVSLEYQRLLASPQGSQPPATDDILNQSFELQPQEIEPEMPSFQREESPVPELGFKKLVPVIKEEPKCQGNNTGQPMLLPTSTASNGPSQSLSFLVMAMFAAGMASLGSHFRHFFSE